VTHMLTYHLLKVKDVLISDNRQRRHFDPKRLDELADSIRRNGLFHPIVVESLDRPILRSGERRLRAVTRLIDTDYLHNGVRVSAGFIPVTITGELDDVTREEVELEENIVRVDLSWQERNDAIARLHDLRGKQKAAIGQKQTYTATAQEIRGGDANAHDMLAVRNATLLQPFRDDPDVKKAGSEREALAIVRKKLTQAFTQRLAANFDTTKGNVPHSLIKGSCIDAMPALPAATFDCIIVDPPYGINAHKMVPMSGSESGVVHEYEDTIENAQAIWETIFKEGIRVCKAAAHIYMFCDFRHFTSLSILAGDYGWDVWPTPLIWHKPAGGNLGDSTRGPRKSYEVILFASRGDKRVTGVYLDVIISNPVDSQTHAAAKPVDVYINLLRRSCVPGDAALDPCAGSGTLFPAANQLHLKATGIEIDNRHYSVALLRMGEK
jgi:site-specific DNA-methyltransferase (adenine-specific)